MEAPKLSKGTVGQEDAEAIKELILNDPLFSQYPQLAEDPATQEMFQRNWITPGGDAVDPKAFIDGRLEALKMLEGVEQFVPHPDSQGSRHWSTDNQE